ncbi:unnamed protein product [Prorocentrum cordatum]|uniref:RING-CH-type domain-containing protein n=1 Tax=Prorocentrum cordatum TaxID=2364126 RepID=A0ABN9UND9_9DINO|nr:unnamed protein product [Polarella glacialis]
MPAGGGRGPMPEGAEAPAPGTACRICLSGPGGEGVCSPCPCRGSLRWVHLSCLRTEFLARQQWTQLTCSICKNEFSGEPALLLAALALQSAEAAWGSESVGTLVCADHLGRLLSNAGELAEAEPHLRRALAGLELALGPEDPEVLIAASNMGMLLKCQGRVEEAEPLARRAWRGSCAVRGEEHPETLVFGMNLAAALRELGKAEEAEPLLRQALAGLGKERGDQHPDALAAAASDGQQPAPPAASPIPVVAAWYPCRALVGYFGYWFMGLKFLFLEL